MMLQSTNDLVPAASTQDFSIFPALLGWPGTGTRPDTYGRFDFDQEENGKLSRDTSSRGT